MCRYLNGCETLKCDTASTLTASWSLEMHAVPRGSDWLISDKFSSQFIQPSTINTLRLHQAFKVQWKRSALPNRRQRDISLLIDWHCEVSRWKSNQTDNWQVSEQEYSTGYLSSQIEALSSCMTFFKPFSFFIVEVETKQHSSGFSCSTFDDWRVTTIVLSGHFRGRKYDIPVYLWFRHIPYLIFVFLFHRKHSNKNKSTDSH